jgi:hypothetical protein
VPQIDPAPARDLPAKDVPKKVNPDRPDAPPPPPGIDRAPAVLPPPVNRKS